MYVFTLHGSIMHISYIYYVTFISIYEGDFLFVSNCNMSKHDHLSY